MSFITRHLGLPGAMVNAHPLKLCTRHNGQAEPGGGIELGGKWVCHGCWQRLRQIKPKPIKETS